MATQTDQYLTLAEGSRQCGYPSVAISSAISRGAINPGIFPVVAGKRVVPASLLPEVKRLLETDRRKLRKQRRLEGATAGS